MSKPCIHLVTIVHFGHISTSPDILPWSITFRLLLGVGIDHPHEAIEVRFFVAAVGVVTEVLIAVVAAVGVVAEVLTVAVVAGRTAFVQRIVPLVQDPLVRPHSPG